MKSRALVLNRIFPVYYFAKHLFVFRKGCSEDFTATQPERVPELPHRSALTWAALIYCSVFLSLDLPSCVWAEQWPWGVRDPSARERSSCLGQFLD